LRGTGPSGLAGIRERLGIFGRPWLGLRRSELRKYLQAGDRSWREDPSNANQRYMRTRLRDRLVPLVVELAGEKSLSALGRLAELGGEERAGIVEVAADDWRTCRSPAGLDVVRLAAFSPARRALVLRRWLHEKNLVPPRRVIADLDRLVLAPGPAGPYRLPNGLMAQRGYQDLHWCEEEPATYQPWEPFAARPDEDHTFADGRLQLSVRSNVDEAATGWWVAESQLGECRWRPTWPGARMNAAGIEKPVKLQNLFVNAKIPRNLRPVWPLLTRNEEILLIPGIRAGKMLISPPKSEKRVLVRLEWL